MKTRARPEEIATDFGATHTDGELGILLAQAHAFIGGGNLCPNSTRPS